MKIVTKFLFWYNSIEQGSPVPGKGVGSGGKTYNENLLVMEGGNPAPTFLGNRVNKFLKSKFEMCRQN